jgi:uncharacterized membrane protein YqaE (UPF0057 family)
MSVMCVTEAELARLVIAFFLLCAGVWLAVSMNSRPGGE